jgi:hypothetical protein
LRPVGLYCAPYITRDSLCHDNARDPAGTPAIRGSPYNIETISHHQQAYLFSQQEVP